MYRAGDIVSICRFWWPPTDVQRGIRIEEAFLSESGVAWYYGITSKGIPIEFRHSEIKES